MFYIIMIQIQVWYIIVDSIQENLMNMPVMTVLDQINN